MYFKRSKFLIVGISKSGFSVCNALLNLGATCYIYDDNPNNVSLKLIEKLIQSGAKEAEKTKIEEVIQDIDVAVISPGVPIDNEIPILCRKNKKNVIGELELGSYLIKSPIIAVTGTNGKTTTCALVDHVLKTAELNSYLVGNVGTPISSMASKLDDDAVAVVEVSSFQLETIVKFTPHIACVLNVTPDHLSRHYNMENYIYLKQKLLQNLRESEYAVLNEDDKTVKGFETKTRAKVIYFSMINKTDGAYLYENTLYWKNEEIIAVDKLGISGGHNIQNALACICICKLMGIENSVISDALSTFKGVRHRQQEIENYSGIRYVNDSKSTNPDATCQALQSVNGNIILLIGGMYKNSGYDELFKKIAECENVKCVVCFGQSREELYKIANANEIKNVNCVSNFELAVRFAFAIEEVGDTILLSPACSSFDEFSGYEERGERFISLVREHISRLKSNA